MNDHTPWLTLALLGAYHGLNPSMGWLFAVALGLQERSRLAVLRSLGPIAAGHALSVTVVVALVAVAQTWIDPWPLRVVGALALVAFGLYKLLAPLSHPRWVGMHVGARDLVAWSFLMATAHGAGLMLVPILFRLPSSAAAPAPHAGHGAMLMSAAPQVAAVDLAAVGIHTGAMFLAMGAVALLVFERLGLAVLRTAWFNLDRVWAVALVGAGLLTLVL